MTTHLSNHTTRNHDGFALLITIVVISVVLAVGISLLNITVKQISLSITGRDSEVAFHAAQGGVECVQQLLNNNPDYIAGVELPSGAGSISCLGQTGAMSIDNDNPQTDVDEYSFRIGWDNDDDLGDDVCTEVDMYLMDARGGALTNVTFVDQGLESADCEDGEYCAVVFSRGFNRPCNELDSLRTVQREITITL
jgi:hypothetical protein